MKLLRRRVDFISLSAEQKISRPRSGYFTFCTRKIFHSSLNFELRQRFLFLFGTHEWDSKDERHRATVRWTVVTASDQAPAGARVESCNVHHEKSTSSEVLFSMKRTLRCMRNEAGLRLMKRDFAVLMVRALHLTSCWIYGNLFE